MTLLVTGGAGFIGSSFVRDWLAESDEPVVNLDKLTYAGDVANLGSLVHDPRHRFVRGDIGDGELVASLLARNKVRAVVHLAAESHVDRSIRGPEDFIQTNVVGTFRLLEACRAYLGALPVERRERFRFVHVSTDEIYGSLDEAAPPFTEQHRYAPNSPYAASKAGSDHLVRAYHRTYGLPTLTTSCSNNYGPYQLPEKLIPLCIERALAGAPLPIYGDGRQVRDWLYVGDHCRALRMVLASGRIGETYNVGADNEQTNLRLVETLCALLDETRPRSDGHSYARQIAFVTDRPGHDRRYAIDASKLRCELGWKPLESFGSGLRRTVEWYLGHRDWLNAATRRRDRVAAGQYA